MQAGVVEVAVLASGFRAEVGIESANAAQRAVLTADGQLAPAEAEAETGGKGGVAVAVGQEGAEAERLLRSGQVIMPLEPTKEHYLFDVGSADDYCII